MKTVVFLLALIVVSSGYFINESFAEISENQAFLLEGSGFAVTEESIRVSEIDLGLSSQKQSGSTINFVTEDGFVTLDNEEFVISKLNGKFLRQGQYIRINGNIESSNGFDTTISFFGRLVEESKDASVYGFTGRITTPDDSYKVLYTTKLSTLSKIDKVATETKKSDQNTIHILKGSSSQTVTKYFSKDRISLEPGTTITFVNDDIVSHKIVSGAGLGTHSSVLSGKVVICEQQDTKVKAGSSYIQSNCDFTLDGRINSNEIKPGESISIKFTETGFYRLLDTNYPWMRIDGYVFPSSTNLVLGTTTNQQGN